ncbi:arf-GAP with Rho-GAP domain, ANK repeat and PH domain-containing protein 1 isoform X2 [Carassius gibelio]|uniref:arf-GAP with Rho-GAP domain, ANK repeat and PH domain-containing protein 1 isoform X2 n=1 Tax=Carassius gibelio TaxID=101364 RepID=UPI00227749E3|nr:arf-GAP with Rho-GAP domain, ANK repeat and PH domain-containing protein 1 isoform X2 [Carassius gibelio]XP_052472591.1 arf-GAP with Rho-GAP domain, ANK repeat and PH domain-containing protein 1 isoform X2 [Carassius gibelio]XP_052472592.1 arf-GAP with Rho-GAP domain, ANK repeat and PH domain-containing protein 1 isoform X2 [Carassius gibelio]
MSFIRPESSLSVAEWLNALRLDQYCSVFQEAGLGTLWECHDLSSAQLQQMGVALPGHRKRILGSLHKLLPSAGGMEEDEERVEERPVAQKRTKFRKTADEGTTENSDAGRRRPPIPPRVMPNRPPVPFTPGSVTMASAPEPISIPEQKETPTPAGRSKPIPTPRPRPEHLSLKGPAQQLQTSERKPSPVSPSSSSSSSECFHLYEQCSSPAQGEAGIPPLPPKSYTVGVSREPRDVPYMPPVPPPRVSCSTTVSPMSTSSGSPPTFSSPADDPFDTDRVPDVPPRKTRPSAEKESSERDVRNQLDSDESSAEYDECEPSGDAKLIDMASKMSLVVPKARKARYSSLCSDDELLEDDTNCYESVSEKRSSWIEDFGSISGSQNSIYLPNTGHVSAPPPREDPASTSVPIIKMGWLYKNPPQGSLIYQHRWVKLDAEYLRYFDTEKDVYSKRIIPTLSITSVVNVGEQKFEVVTHNRTFLFRAESDLERSEWVSVLKSCVGVSHARTSLDVTFNPCVSSEMKGYLELRGLRSKLYTVVCADKVFLYKNTEDYRLGIGITSIDMNVGNVKEVDRRAFDLTTPYRIFSFVADTDQLKDQWVEAMRNSIAEALSNYEVAERIWAEPSNQMCADCSAAKPEWAAINLCVVFCKRCAGEHRGLGQSISKVRSLKMDKKVWTDDLIQLFLALGNERANQFWAANVPPSEALTLNSSSEERRRFIAAKYREGKYRRYHPLFGNQRELNNALCINVQSSDVCETLALVFCGADVSCDSGDPELTSPIALAQHHGQNLQLEFLMQNRNTELPRSEVKVAIDRVHYMAPPSVTHNGFLFKTASMARPITEKKGKEDFSRRWCVLNDGNFSYYESDKNATPNGGLKMKEIVCLAVSPPETHGYDHTFELYSEAERLYLFGTDNPEAMREWVKSIAKSFIPAAAEDLLLKDFERIGRLRYKDRLNREMSRLGWFCLVGSSLHIRLEEHAADETIDLQKLQELSIQSENEVLVLVERGRTLYIEGERKLDFQGWAAAIQRAAGSSGDTLSQQQLTEADIPVIVERCIHFTTQYGLTSEGIYRKSGVNSKIAALLEEFRRDARCVWLKEGEHQVDDVSNVLKRFFRDIEEGLFGLDAHSWLSATAFTDESSRICQYRLLFSNLPRVNQATLRALVNHLYCVQRFADLNQMNLHNLAIVFGPTLFQADGKDYSAGRVIEDLIQHYVTIFDVNELQLKKQLDEITYIIKLRDNLTPKAGTGSGDFICTVYLEEKKDTAEQHVKIPATMTAAELTFEILDRRKISVKEKDYWCCFEVNEKEEMERPLHYQEKVLPIFHSLGTDSHLLVKKHFSMEAMLVYLASKVEVSKHGMMKFREERSLLGLSTGSFNDRYFILTNTSLRLYKEVRSNRAEREWPVKCLKVYHGIKKKLRPPTCWGLTVIYESEKQEKQERQQWCLCCDTQNEMREWFATFMSIQNGGRVWPAEWLKSRATSRSAPLDARFALQKCLTE